MLQTLDIQDFYTRISALFLGKDGTELAYRVSGEYMKRLGYFFLFMGIKMATDGVLRGLGVMRPFLLANLVNLAIRLSVALLCAPRFGITFTASLKYKAAHTDRATFFVLFRLTAGIQSFPAFQLDGSRYRK